MAVYEIESPVEVITETERQASLLEAAALEIEVRGHSIGADTGKGICLMEAMAVASGLSEMAWVRMGVEWGSEFGPSGAECHTLWSWNDNLCDGGKDAAFLLRWRAAELRDGLS